MDFKKKHNELMKNIDELNEKKRMYYEAIKEIDKIMQEQNGKKKKTANDIKTIPVKRRIQRTSPDPSCRDEDLAKLMVQRLLLALPSPYPTLALLYP